MKWTNIGSENIPYVNIADMVRQNPVFCIYGAGKLGNELYGLLKKFDLFDCFIDNNVEKQKSGYNGEIVISEEDFWKKPVRPFIVIAASAANTCDIKKHLQEKGLIYDRDFFTFREFVNKIFPVIAYYVFDKTFVNVAQICVTERCSLKCKKCAHGCYAVKADNEDLTIEQVKKSADSFFSKVDYVRQFVLIGGEPLLYRQLAEAVDYIGSKYRDKMNIFSITTNGTIKPSDKLLSACKKYDVLFRISNYSKQLPRLEKQYRILSELFEKNGVRYNIGPQDTSWMDYGFEYVDRNGTETELIAVFDSCNTPCHEIRENKFYFCVMARSVSENLSKNVGEDDYLDFDKLVSPNWKRELLEFILGYSEKGYLDMCNYCYGAECYKHPIPVAEQLQLN